MVHRYACKSSARDINPIIEDDGDPDWVNIETYNPHYDDTRLRENSFSSTKKDAEIFIDVLNASPYRKGEVVRIRTRTLSPTFLRSCRASWNFLRHRDVIVAGRDLVRTQAFTVRFPPHLPFRTEQSVNSDSWASNQTTP